MDRCPPQRVFRRSWYHLARARAIQLAGTAPLRPTVHGEGMSRAGTVQAYSQGSADPPREGLQPGVEANLASTPTNRTTSTGLATMRPDGAKCGPSRSLCVRDLYLKRQRANRRTYSLRAGRHLSCSCESKTNKKVLNYLYSGLHVKLMHLPLLLSFFMLYLHPSL